MSALLAPMLLSFLRDPSLELVRMFWMRQFYLSTKFLRLFFIITSSQINNISLFQDPTHMLSSMSPIGCWRCKILLSLILSYNKQGMVYIKLTNEMWIASGLEKIISPNAIVTIDNSRFIPYADFRNASRLIDHPIHTLIKRDHIISNIDMKRIRKEAELSPEDHKWRDQLKLKHQLRVLNGDKINAGAYYFQEKKDESVKDFTKTISFGMTFIFSFFMAGLTGYYFGVYFLSLSFTQALIVAAFFIMGTIIIETALFIIKQSREDNRRTGKDQQGHKFESQLGRRKQKQRIRRPTEKPKVD